MGTDGLLGGAGVTDSEVKLGQHVALSGEHAAEYRDVVLSIEAYFRYVNAEGRGVCGRNIVLLVEDDSGSPIAAREKAEKLAQVDQVAAFVGNVGTAPNTGSSQYINEQEIPDLFIATGATAFTDTDALPWTVVFNPDYASEGAVLASYLNDNHADRTVAVLYQSDAFGQEGRDAFVENFGGEVVAEESYESTASEITSQLANLMNASPDILYLYSTSPYTARVYEYMRENDWTPQVVMSYVNSVTNLAGLIGGEGGPQAGFPQLAGAISTNYTLHPTADSTEPAVQDHVQIMSQHGGPPASPLTVYAQAMAETIVHMLEIACENGDMTRAGIMEAAESIEGFHPSLLLEGIDITVNADDHSAIQSLVPVEIQADGTLEPLVDEPIEAEVE
jgi:branched-chain amino acid transport system substrate-binding protein